MLKEQEPVWNLQGEGELPPLPAEAAGNHEEEAEDDGAGVQGTDIEQGSAKVCSPTATHALAVLSCMMHIMHSHLQFSSTPQYDFFSTQHSTAQRNAH